MSGLLGLLGLLGLVARAGAQTPPPSAGWPTVAGTPQRTSWTTDEVSGALKVDWYRPIEAYIDQKVQVIATAGKVYLSTSKGLCAFDAATGALAFRYDTELPLGHSPTVAGGVAYVGGYDKKLHAVDATTGKARWVFDGARAGFNTNPLVLDGRVYAGSRDGYFYALDAATGRLVWQYPRAGEAPLGPIMLSAAHDAGTLYFASNNMFAYALRASDGTLLWRSSKLPGLQLQSFWPVVYGNLVLFSTAFAYRPGKPGKDSLDGFQLQDLFPEMTEGTLVGTEVTPPAWAQGRTTLRASRVTEYLEKRPTATDPRKGKPWRRVVVALNKSTGVEYTYDSDGDGNPEYLPATFWGTGSGNYYPPIVAPNGNLYFNGAWRCCGDAKGRVYAWNPADPGLLAYAGGSAQGGGGFGALAEPQALSGAGSTIYRSICCDRVLDWFKTTPGLNPGQAQGQAYSYDLSKLAPGYDSMWTILPGWPRLQGWYKGTTSSPNGIYHNHGDQNPAVPYGGRVFIHRSNALIAFSPTGAGTAHPLLPIVAATDAVSAPSADELKARLASEVRKLVDAGHLRPGYYNTSQFVNAGPLDAYFENPGDTLYSLALAYPHLPAELQGRVKAYLENQVKTFFDPAMHATIGWATGAAREDSEVPPDIAPLFASYPAKAASPGFSWSYPPFNFYALAKVAERVPGMDVAKLYALAKGKLQVPVSSLATDDWFKQRPYEHNAWIGGYVGFLELQQRAGMQTTDAALRARVQAELDRLLALRKTLFSKDTYWIRPAENYFNYHRKHLDVARNFLYLTPRLAEHLAREVPAARVALAEYEYLAPYWFVSRYEATKGEGVMQPLYDVPALFQARALLLKQSRQALYKVLDVPAFTRGDLFYLQNLTLAIEASDDGSAPKPPLPDGGGAPGGGGSGDGGLAGGPGGGTGGQGGHGDGGASGGANGGANGGATGSGSSGGAESDRAQAAGGCAVGAGSLSIEGGLGLGVLLGALIRRRRRA